jgi:hypothetical protein
MTEVGNLVADRTGGSNVGKSNKKQSPQEAWMDLLQASVESAPTSIQSHLQRMVTTLDNIPRKEKQFRNFAMNSLNLGRGTHASQIVDTIWKHLSQQRERQKQEREASAPSSTQSKKDSSTSKHTDQTQSSATQGDADNKSKPKAAMPSDDSDSDDNEEEPRNKASATSTSAPDNSKKSSSVAKTNQSKSNFKTVKKATKKILKEAPGKSMKYKKLTKKLHKMLEKEDCTKEETIGLLEKVIAKEKKKYALDGKDIKLIV